MKIDFASLDSFLKTSPSLEGTLVLLMAADGKLGKVAQRLNDASQGAIERAMALAGDRIKRRPIELISPAGLPVDRILIFGLDASAATSSLELEHWGGKIAEKLRDLDATTAHLVAELPTEVEIDTTALAASLAFGARLKNYRFDRYKTEENEETAGTRGDLADLIVHLDDPLKAAALWTRLDAVAKGIEQGRDLVAEPANVLTPAAFAEACRGLEGEVGLQVEVLDKSALERLGMGALLGVAQGSANEPFVVVMHWQGGEEGEAPVALVGKGVCFDSGGLSLKPAAGMEEMKSDMGGAAAVFGAMKAIAGRRAKANVVAVLGLVENMVSSQAQRPGDVVKAMSGTTIEVINTDAEGRLVLADALHYTKERFAPKVMIDLATLTGAVVVALGQEQAGLFTEDDALARQIEAAGRKIGEPVWRLTIGGPYAKHIKSDIADIKNTGRTRQAGATAGAVFLQHFAGKGSWAHIDIAGVAWSKCNLPLSIKGATGFGIRLLDQLIAEHYEG